MLSLMKAQRFPLFIATGLFAAVVAFTATQTGAVKDEALEKIAAALPDSAPAKPRAERKVLVFTKTNGFRHDSIPTGVASLTKLGEQTGAFSVTPTEDESLFEPESLEAFDAVIMLNTTGDVFRPAKLPEEESARKAALEREERLKKSLVDFVKSGKGLAGMHSATDTYANWKEYNDMMGGAFDGHPWHMEVPIKNLDPEHPVNAAFEGKGFEVNDEIYQFRGDTASPAERRMLLALNDEKMDVSRGKREDGFYPISWVDTYGEGRVFYCSLGHNDHIFWNPAVLRHYLAGIQYALGDLEAPADPK